MEAGLGGVHGEVAAKRAVVGEGVDQGAARAHHLDMVGNGVWEVYRKRERVTHISVQVRKPEAFTELSY